MSKFCLECNGSGVITNGDITKKCKCVIKKQIIQSLPLELRKKDYKVNQNQLKLLLQRPKINLTKKVYYISSNKLFFETMKTIATALFIKNNGNYITHFTTADEIVTTIFSEEQITEYQKPDLLIIEYNLSTQKNSMLNPAILSILKERDNKDKSTIVRIDYSIEIKKDGNDHIYYNHENFINFKPLGDYLLNQKSEGKPAKGAQFLQG